MNTVAPLLLMAATKQKGGEEMRKRREVHFPQSAAEYYTIEDKDLQQRLARFLTSDAIVQEQMLTEYGWTSRQVQGLKEVYSKEVRLIRSISHHIQKTYLQPTFRDEIQRRVAVVRDPRRKPTFHT
jgi:hypothetical protein